MFSNRLWTAEVDSSSLIEGGGESIWDSLVEKLSWKTCRRSPALAWAGALRIRSMMTVDSSVLLQLQGVVSWSVAPTVNIDAGCSSNAKSSFILRERKRLMWQCMFLTASIFYLPVECNC